MSPNLPASTSSSTLIPTKLVSRCQNCGKTHRPPCQACPECGKRHPPPCDPRFVARRSFYCDSKINNQAQKDPNVELPKPRFILDQHRNVQRPTSTTFSTTTEEASETSGTGAKPKSGSKMPFQRVCHTCGDHHHGPCFSGNFSLFCSPAGGGISPITATPTDSGALREFENKPPHMQSRNGKDSEEPGTRENSPLKPYSAASHGVDDLATSFLRSSLKHIGEEQYDNDSGSSSANIKTPDSLTDDQRSVSTNTRTELRFMLQGITEHQKKFGPAQKLLPDEEFGVVHSPISGSGVWFETEDQSPLAKQRDADIDARISRLKSQLLEFELAQAREALDSTSQEQERGFEPIRRRLESGSEQALDQGLEEVTGFETDPRNTCTSQLYRPHNTRLGLDGTDDGTYSPSKSAKDAASTYENDDESSLPQSGQQEFLEHDEHHSVMPLVQLDLESTDQELAGKEFASQISQSRADSKADSVATSSQRAEQNPDEQLTDCWNCLSWLDERETNKQETQDDRHRASPEGQALTSVPVSPNSVEDPQSDQLTDLYKDLVYFGQNEVVANSFPDAQDSRCLDPIPIVENRDRTPWSATKTSTGILLEAFAVQNTGTDGTTAHTDSETAAGHLVCRPPFVALPIFVSRDRPPHRPVMKLPGLTLEQQNYLKIHGLLADQPRINMQDAQKPDPTDTCPYLYWIPRRKDVSPPLTALEARAADDAQFVPPDTSQNERWPNPRQPFHAELLTGAAYFTRWQRWADHIHEGAPWPPVDFL